MNLTKLTCGYIDSHPFIKECLKKGLINYSALSRKIMEENRMKEGENLDAIVVAVRRYAEKTKPSLQNEKKLRKLLKKAKLEIRNKIGVTILDKHLNYDKLSSIIKEISKKADIFHLVYGTSTITVITEQEFNQKFSQTFSHYLINQKSGLVEIAIKTSSEVESVLGWEAFLSGLLAENGVIFSKCIGSWEDNIYIIDEKDLAKAMQILKI